LYSTDSGATYPTLASGLSPSSTSTTRNGSAGALYKIYAVSGSFQSTALTNP
jgi:hypothetical protein